MEKFTEERKVTETRFRAKDGRVFATEEQCREYEKSYDCTIKKMWNDIPKEKTCVYNIYPNNCDDDSEAVLVKVRDIEDVKTINAYLTNLVGCGGETPLGKDDIGKEIVFLIGYEWYSYKGTVEKHFADMMEYFTEMHNKLNGIEEPKETKE